MTEVRAPIPSEADMLDDSVTLDVGLSWTDPDTNTFQTEHAQFQRGSCEWTATAVSPSSVSGRVVAMVRWDGRREGTAPCTYEGGACEWAGEGASRAPSGSW